MPRNAFIVVRRDGRATVHAARDAEVFPLLLGGPEGLERVVSLPTAELPNAVQAGWIADLDERRVVLYHAPRGRIVLVPVEEMGRVYERWSGYAVRFTDDAAGGLHAYLAGDRRVFLEAEAQTAASVLRDRLHQLTAVPEERSDQLREEERALPRPPPPPSRPFFTAFSAILLLATLLAGFLLRLVLVPFRRILRARAEPNDALVAEYQRRRLEDEVRELESPAASGNTVDSRFVRGLMLLKLDDRAAELAFHECVERLEAGESGGKVTIAEALYNRGLARERLRLMALGARDIARAVALKPELGVRPKPPPFVGLRRLARRLVVDFREAAGLGR